jgi:hypothetical protein
MYEIVILMVGIGALIAAVPCFCVWWFTKKLPVWLRLLAVTFMIAICITPVGGGSEGGPWFATLGLVLPFTLFDLARASLFSVPVDSSYVSLHKLFSTEAILYFLGIWGIAYLIAMLVFGCIRIFKRRTKNVA